MANSFVTPRRCSAETTSSRQASELSHFLTSKNSFLCVLYPQTQNTLKKYSVILKELSNIAGSRNQNGDVPEVNWNADNRKVYINWYNSDNRNDNLRSRSEVSLPVGRQVHKKELLAPFVLNI
mgnify:FL=1